MFGGVDRYEFLPGPRQRDEYDKGLGAVLDLAAEDEPERQTVEALLEAVNIGWLAYAVPYAKGQTPANFQSSLLQLCVNASWSHRGYHICELEPCTGDEPLAVGSGSAATILGSGVIVVSGPIRTYAAPNLIYHYVAEHGYRPPDEFIDAVLATTGTSRP